MTDVMENAMTSDTDKNHTASDVKTRLEGDLWVSPSLQNINESQYQPVFDVIHYLEQQDEFFSMDIHFARFVMAEYYSEFNSVEDIHDNQIKQANLLVFLSALLSKNILNQHTCLLLEHAKQDCTNRQLPFSLPEASQWQDILLSCDLVIDGSCLIEENSTSIAELTNSPFVLFNNKLYTLRYFQYELQLAKFIQQKNKATSSNYWYQQLKKQQIEQVVSPLFVNSAQANANNEVDWQQQAVSNSINQGFAVICGGPGTGKTTTVVKLLVALQRLKQQSVSETQASSEQALNIQLVAPTGKAAQRLSESINQSKTSLGLTTDELNQIPDQALTIHRLLKPRGKTEFFHDENNPLFCDVLILDEASMVDISLFNRLISALPVHAQLILLGDKQQLASVEAGNVLADLYHSAVVDKNQNSENAQYDFVTELKKSYRFRADSEIGQLASAIKTGSTKSVVNTLQHSVITDTQLLDYDGRALNWFQPKYDQLPFVIEMAVSHYLSIHQQLSELGNSDFTTAMLALFKRLSEFQVLCCVKQSKWGVEQINEQVKQRLSRRLKTPFYQQHYTGRPIMITENAYHMGLFNGDIGIEVFDPVTKQLVACFIEVNSTVEKSADPNTEISIKKVNCQRLPAHQSCYAMTVHKSQGSEFQHVALVLPESYSLANTVTRELFYTGLTRAKTRFSLYGSSQNITNAIVKQTQRQSGLVEILHALS